MDYQEFLKRKLPRPQSCGVEIEAGELHESLFHFQRAATAWAIKKGRAALFLDTGLGKTRCQVEWARVSGKRVLILAPLAVAEQTIEEAAKIGVEVKWAARPVDEDGIWITNYQKLEHFIGHPYDAIVLDESSILKSLDGKTRTMLIKKFSHIPRRLCCTATPAPNDLSELANHAEFLGVMTRAEMLAHFFVHDSEGSASVGGWRLKGHAQEAFWRWVSNWAVWVRKPSDLNFPDEGFELPPLSIREEQVDCEWIPDGELFPRLTKGIKGRGEARRHTLDARVKRAMEVIEESWRNDHRDIGSNTTPSIESSDLQKSKSIISNTGRAECNINATTTATTGKTTGRKKKTQCLEVNSDFLSKSTNFYPLNREIAALSAKGLHEDRSALIMTTSPEKSEGCSAIPAMPDLDSSLTTPSLLQMPSTTCSGMQWIIWCKLNAEQDAIVKLLGKKAVSISGSDSDDSKVEKALSWKRGEVEVLVTKPEIFGWGMNFQNCFNVLYLGMGDSFESYYQSIRRCWRFGQKHPVNVVIVTSTAEVEVVENVKRKEKQAAQLAEGIINAVKDAQIEEVTGERKKVQEYETKDEIGDNYHLMLGDCVERIKEVPAGLIGLSIFSPPFSNLFVYSASERDIGNVKDYTEFFEHFDFLISELLRITMPGRLCAVHCQQVAKTKMKDGIIGRYDFRGDLIRAFCNHGWNYASEVVIDKDPQVAAVRTKSKSLMFMQKNKDSSWSWPAMADYLLIFQAPGENTKPVLTDATNEDWIKWAHPVWVGIKESGTLNAAIARENADERHLAPLQLEVIERAVRLWSNRGEFIFDPFTGIGSTGYVALQHGRQFVGCELKMSYFKQALRNIKSVAHQGGLFSNVGD